jgi:acetolactate decarboxylase
MRWRKNMNKSSLIMAAVVLVATLAAAGCRPALQSDRDTLYQVSSISALMQGVYEGSVTVGDLRKYGDFGLGTFDALDGEMVELDGKFYQVKLDGTVLAVPDSLKTPFAAVTFFDNDKSYTLDRPVDLSGLQTCIDSLLPSLNLFYAVRVDGVFSYMKTRSVPPQSLPYLPLADAVKGQQVSEFRDVEGTMIGFRCPPYVDGVNVPGYHFHFLDKERKRGGHVLDCSASDVSINIDNTASMIMALPETAGFYRVDLGKAAAEALKKVEQGK